MKMECEGHSSGEVSGGRGGTLGFFLQVFFVGLVVIFVGVVISLFFSSRFVGVKYHRYMMDMAGGGIRGHPGAPGRAATVWCEGLVG
jgi:hypothetical protein